MQIKLNGKLVEASKIQIPDLWHIAQAQEIPELKERILYTWHAAHALLEAMRPPADSVSLPRQQRDILVKSIDDLLRSSSEAEYLETEDALAVLQNVRLTLAKL